MPTNTKCTDIILVGGGIMSATLATFLKLLHPGITIRIFERGTAVGYESSDALNNAGTGHSALCELNYTHREGDTINTHKADTIMEKFEISKQFWAYLVENNFLTHGNDFINRVPHMSLVFGQKDVSFLKKRYETLIQNPLFADMMYTQDVQVMKERFPLIMHNRDTSQPMAATRSEIGTDVNFGTLTRNMFDFLNTDKNIHTHLHHEVIDLKQNSDSTREVYVRDRSSVGKKARTLNAKKVFLGCGGMAIPLLAKSGIPEGKLYGGFPIDGQWLMCNNPEIVQQHHGKVYGNAAVDAPPMSVPHLDTRIINGRKTLIFGPYAGFTTKFLKQGSRTDLFTSLTRHNIIPMIQTGIKNRGLSKYLIQQVTQNKKDRLTALLHYYPDAKNKDWYREHAGKRVQIIKKDPIKGGILQFGTEVVVSQDKTIAALLGASPGASISVSIIIEVLESMFHQEFASPQRQEAVKTILPSYGITLRDNPELAQEIRSHTHTILNINKQTANKKIVGTHH